MICNYLIFDIISKIKYNIYNFTISKVLGGDWVGLYDFMVEKYGYDEVILLNEIYYKEYSKAWIKKEVKKLCAEDKLVRFDKGVYYIPTDTILGKSVLNPRKVIRKKYINDGSKTIGYFSGTTLTNSLGLSMQVPNIIEIYTNNEQSRVREVPIGKQKVILRRARTEINDENVSTMCFLELMNFTDSTFYNDEKREKVIKYIKEMGINRKKILQCSPYFPDKAMRTMVESELIYEIA